MKRIKQHSNSGYIMVSLFISPCHSPTTITGKNLIINHLYWLFLFPAGSACLLSATSTSSSRHCYCQAGYPKRIAMP